MPTTPAKTRFSKSSKRYDETILSPSALDFDRSCRIVNETTDSVCPGDIPLTERIHEFKLVVVGDGGVGKTSLVKRLTSGTFDPNYQCTHGADTNTISFATNRGILKFHTWDTAGVERFGGLRDGYYVGSQAAIVMFDLKSRVSYKNVAHWHQEVVRVCPDIPVILLGNKKDSKYRKVKSNHMSLPRKLKCKYFEISAKKFTGLTQPFLHLAKRLMNDSELNFIGNPPTSLRLFSGAAKTDDAGSEEMAPVCGFSNKYLKELEQTGDLISKRRKELLVAAATPLPDDSGNGDDL